MYALKVLAIAFFIFISPNARAGFYIPKTAEAIITINPVSDTTVNRTKHPHHYKEKKVTKERSLVYALVGFLPPAFLITPSPVRRYLGYRQIPIGYFILQAFLVAGIALLFTPWITSALILLAFYLLFHLALAFADLKQLLSGRLYPVRGRYFSRHLFG